MTMIAQETVAPTFPAPVPFEFWITDYGAGSLVWIGLEKGARVSLVCRRALRLAGYDPRRGAGPWYGRFFVASLRQQPKGRYLGAWITYPEPGDVSPLHARLTIQGGDALDLPDALWDRFGITPAHVRRIDFGPGTESRVYFTARRR